MTHLCIAVLFHHKKWGIDESWDIETEGRQMHKVVCNMCPDVWSKCSEWAKESRLVITRIWVGSDWKDDNGAQFLFGGWKCSGIRLWWCLHSFMTTKNYWVVFCKSMNVVVENITKRKTALCRNRATQIKPLTKQLLVRVSGRGPEDALGYCSCSVFWSRCWLHGF